VVPFVVLGGGLLGISSSRQVLGSDVDSEAHAGVGVKGYVTSSLALRLEVRDNFTQGLGRGERAQHVDILLGLTLVLGRPVPLPPAPPDSDGDGVVDPDDRCPALAGPAPLGCPKAPDRDTDGILDADDACPEIAGVPSGDATRNGCPPPPLDSDDDGVPDVRDYCPRLAGDAADGCLLDSDRDGIPDRADECVDRAETLNGFEDKDGCPDELPKAVAKFTGTIAGISFESGKAVIRPQSFRVLDEASRVLKEFSELRLEISGHTDATGTPERNSALSKGRADAVRAYIVGQGIAEERIMTRGVGGNEPVADNETPEGRSKNRRVEFKLLSEPTAQVPGSEPAPPLEP
jgi:OOP family OmpA-OmpF porin